MKETYDFSNVKVEPLFKDMVDFETFSKSDFRAVKVKECEAVPKSKKLLKFVLDDGSGENRVILSGIHDYYEPEELVGNRMCMLLTNSAAIRDVLLFPTMKSMGAAKNEANNAAQSAPAKSVATFTATSDMAEKIDFSNVEVEPLFEDMVDFDTFSKSDFRAVKVQECEAVPKSKKFLKYVLDDGSGVERVRLSGIHDYDDPEELEGKTLLAITKLPPRKMM